MKDGLASNQSMASVVERRFNKLGRSLVVHLFQDGSLIITSCYDRASSSRRVLKMSVTKLKKNSPDVEIIHERSSKSPIH